MRIRSTSIALLLLALCAPARAQLGGGTLKAHDHSTTRKGGATLRPSGIVAAGVTATTGTFRNLNVPGLYVLVASATFTNAAAQQFSGLASSVAYRLELNVVTGRASAGYFETHFLDAEGDYGYSFFNQDILNYNVSPATENWQSHGLDTASAKGAHWACLSHFLAPQSFVVGAMEFETRQSTPSLVDFYGYSKSSDTLANNVFAKTSFSGHTTVGASGLGSVTYGVPGGTMTGTAFLYKRIPPTNYLNGGGLAVSSITNHGHTSIDDGGILANVIMTGTATVQGNAFSVGGNTFTVTGGSATVANRLTAGSIAIGVGSYEPTHKMEIINAANTGVVLSSGPSGNGWIVANDCSNASRRNFGFAQSVVAAGDASLKIGTNNCSDDPINGSGTRLMTFNATGVSIGPGATTPTVPLEVKSVGHSAMKISRTAGSDSTLTIDAPTGQFSAVSHLIDGAGGWLVGVNATGTDWAARENTNSTNKIVLKTGTSGNVLINQTGGNVGIATTTPSALLTLNGSFAVASSSINTTASLAASSKQFQYCNAGAGAVTFNAVTCSAANQGLLFTIKKVDGSANACIFDPATTELVDDASTNSITTQYDSRTYHCSNGAWWVH